MSAGVLDSPSLAGTMPLNGDIERGYELVHGRLVEMPPMSNRDMSVAANLLENLRPFVRRARLGRMSHEWIFRLGPDAPRTWRPDAAFVSFDRWPVGQPEPDADPWTIVPDMALEVVSHTNLADDIMDRLQAYFGAGARQVWVVYPRHERVYLYDSETSVRILSATDTLDGGALFPEFRMPVADLFADMGGEGPG